MKMPNFWKNENCISFLLYPLSYIYSFGRFLHILFSTEYRNENVKILCIGNVVIGGSGKTPIAIKIGKILKEKNINFAFLSKGYKGETKTFIKVDINKHNSSIVGDEPLLLAEVADTFVCKNRIEAIKILSKYNYDLIIMDDGFQNPTIYKNKSILVIDGEYGIGNGQLLPSGPLRETLKSALQRTNFVILLNQDKQNFEDYFRQINFPFTRATIKEKKKFDSYQKYVAFSGIGRNEKFFSSLKKVNCNVIKKISFDDHYNYSGDKFVEIILNAEKDGAKVITTKKDWVKIPNVYKNQIEYLDIDIDFYNDDEFLELLSIENLTKKL